MFGIAAADEELYETLLRQPRRQLAELERLSGRSADSLRRALARLEDHGLVSRLVDRPERYVATRPDLAVEHLAARHRQRLTSARRDADRLLASLPTGSDRGPHDHVELVEGSRAVAARFDQLTRSTERELLVLDRPPYAQDPAEPNQSELELLARGARCRGIYAPEALQQPGALGVLQDACAAGEQARVHPNVPMKLAVSDRACALLPVSYEDTADSALVIHSSTLLDALVALFELLWDMSLPLPDEADGATAPVADDPAERQLLMLLAAGLKDEAVARQLGLSLRTVHRRTHALLERLGARTRFQAGVLAVRRGLIAADAAGGQAVDRSRSSRAT